jgi:uncharacterized membrane protein YfcA
VPEIETRPRPALWVLLLIGLGGGVFSGVFGAGGGIILVPLLVTFARFDQRRAAATSLLAILPSTLAGSIIYLVNGEVDLVAAGVIAVGAVCGSFVGARLLLRLPVPALRWAFIALLVVVAVRIAWVVPVRGEPREFSAGVAVAYLAIGLVMGLTSGLFGVGGGVVSVPLLVGLVGISDLIAKGTSLAVMVVTSTTGSLANRRSGLIDVRTSLIVGAAAACAAVGGAYLALALPPSVSSALFVGLLVLIAVQLTVRAVRTKD